MAKQIQWTWPDEYGEDKYVVMFGGLHIEMAILKTLGDWLRGSGWVQALVQADLASPGIADSFLQATHVARTRRSHQITVVVLYILKHRAYDHYRVTYSGKSRVFWNSNNGLISGKQSALIFSTGQLLWN